MQRARPLAILRYIALVLIATALLLPIYWLLMSSLRPADQIFRHAGTFGLETLVPLQLTFENFRFIFSGTFPRAWAARGAGYHDSGAHYDARALTGPWFTSTVARIMCAQFK